MRNTSQFNTVQHHKAFMSCCQDFIELLNDLWDCGCNLWVYLMVPAEWKGQCIILPGRQKRY